MSDSEESSDDELRCFMASALLSDELLRECFLRLDWRSLLSAGQQCRAWRRVENDHFVWRALVLRDWPEIAATLAASPQSFKSLAMRLPRLQHLEFKLPEECWWIDWTDDGTDEINWTRRAIFSSA
eukprot:1596913-Prymnesium_polylepis.1